MIRGVTSRDAGECASRSQAHAAGLLRGGAQLWVGRSHGVSATPRRGLLRVSAGRVPPRWATCGARFTPCWRPCSTGLRPPQQPVLSCPTRCPGVTVHYCRPWLVSPLDPVGSEQRLETSRTEGLAPAAQQRNARLSAPADDHSSGGAPRRSPASRSYQSGRGRSPMTHWPLPAFWCPVQAQGRSQSERRETTLRRRPRLLDLLWDAPDVVEDLLRPFVDRCAKHTQGRP